MSARSIKVTQGNNDTNRRLSGSSSEKIIFYVDDTSYEISHEQSPDYCQRSNNSYTLCSTEDRESPVYPLPSDPTTGYQLDDHSALYLSSPDDGTRRNVGVHSKTGEQRPTKNVSEHNQCSSRRSSVQSSRSRANSCSRSTPLGNGRRGSTSRRAKPRRASTARREDSSRALKVETKEIEKTAEDGQAVEQARRHRRIAMIVLGTFLFLLAASVLVVVVTLTHSSFLSPAVGSKELAEHRARLRRENEELLNSLNRVFVTENSTILP